MAPNSRKRPVDPRWETSGASRARSNLDSDAAPSIPESSRTNVEIPIRTPSRRPLARASPSTLRQDFGVRPPAGAPEGVSELVPSEAPYPASPSPAPVQRIVQRGARSGVRTVAQPTPCKPGVFLPPHPDSKLCQDFHWVPYPLGLMPYESWHNLHHREEVQPRLPFRCPVCRRERKASGHIRKVFLVAERLTWEEGLVSIHDKDLNEELNWKVNYELGILDPFVEDREQVVGGKNSRHNKFYPYQNGHELKLALNLIFMTENITETSWALWIGTQLDFEMMHCEAEEMDAMSFSSRLTPKERKLPSFDKNDGTHLITPGLENVGHTVSADHAFPAASKTLGLPTPPSSLKKGPEAAYSATKTATLDARQAHISSSNASNMGQDTELPATLSRIERIVSYKTLQDFYSLLDRIERTSYVGAQFLEAYAEKLRGEMCNTCWFDRNVKLDAV